MGSRYIPIGWVLTGFAWTSLACHQMSNILHLSTSAVLANSLSFSHTMPSSSPNSVIPPLSFTNLLLLLLHFTIIPQPSHSCSIRLPTISNLGCLCASFHSPLTSLQASYIHQDFPHFPPPPLPTNLGGLPHKSPHHPKISRLCFKFCTYLIILRLPSLTTSVAVWLGVIRIATQ